MEDFLKMPQWLDVVDELKEWERDIQEIQDTDDRAEELYRCQGRKEALKHLLNCPEVLLDRLETGGNKDG